MEAADTSLQHLKRLLAIADDLAKEGVAIYAHEYRRLSCGSFSVEFGRPNYRVLCEWDGKGSRLSISFAKAADQSYSSEWTHEANITVSADDVYAEIASNVHTMVVA